MRYALKRCAVPLQMCTRQSSISRLPSFVHRTAAVTPLPGKKLMVQARPLRWM